MTNREARQKCIYAGILSYSSQIGLIDSLHLRKNQTELVAKFNLDEEEIKKIGAEKVSKKVQVNTDSDTASLEIESAINELLDREFEGNFFYVPLSNIGNIKGETIPLNNGSSADAKWLAEQLIGSIIVE